MKFSKVAITVASAAMIFGGTGILANASAKKHATLVGSNYIQKTKKLSVKRNGALYTSYKLNKVKGHLKSYKNKTFKANLIYSIKKTNGKTAKYYYVKSGKIKGYAWVGLFKTAKTTAKKAVTKPAATTTKTPAKKTSSSDSDATSNKTFSLNVSEYRAAFLSYVNAQRAKRGIAPLTEDNDMNTLAAYRANQLLTNYSHVDSQGHMIALSVATKLGVHQPTSEDMTEQPIGDDGWSDLTQTTITTSAVDGKTDAYQYIYEDADDNWGHRDSLLNKNYTKIGIGVVYDQKGNVTYSCEDLY